MYLLDPLNPCQCSPGLFALGLPFSAILKSLGPYDTASLSRRSSASVMNSGRYMSPGGA